jgi:hypothetical protein
MTKPDSTSSGSLTQPQDPLSAKAALDGDQFDVDVGCLS